MSGDTTSFPIQRLQVKFLPAVPGTNAAASAASAAVFAAQAQAATTTKVDRAGDTMTGLLTLSADPANALDAATKQYVDTTRAPLDAQYIVAAPNALLTAERVLTNTPTVTWDFSTPGQVKATSGNVNSSGSPLVGQLAQWTSATMIQGVSVTAAGAQPLSADLTSIAAQAATNQFFYRASAGNWAPVTIGANLSFVSGTLVGTAGGSGTGNVNSIGGGYSVSTLVGYADGSGGLIRAISIGSGLTLTGTVLSAIAGGNVSNSGTPTVGQLAVWTDATHVQGVTSIYAPIANPVFTGDARCVTAAATDNDTSIATTAFVKTAIAAAPIPAGTLMLFQQSTAPTGWTKQTTHNDKSLRVVSGAAGSGGSVPFSTVFARSTTDGFTLTTNEMPSHAHGVSDFQHAHSIPDPGHAHSIADNPHTHSAHMTLIAGVGSVPVFTDGNIGAASTGGPYYLGTGYGDSNITVDPSGTGIGIYAAATGINATSAATSNIAIAAAGGGASHSHGVEMRVQYVDMIIASKN
jgi:hypothetical protein